MGRTWKYYDFVLLGVIGSLAAGAGIGLFTPVGLTVSIPVLSFVALAIMVHGLFVNGPVDEVSDLSEEVESLD